MIAFLLIGTSAYHSGTGKIGCNPVNLKEFGRCAVSRDSSLPGELKPKVILLKFCLMTASLPNMTMIPNHGAIIIGSVPIGRLLLMLIQSMWRKRSCIFLNW